MKWRIWIKKIFGKAGLTIREIGACKIINGRVKKLKLKVEAKDTMCFSFEEPRKFFFYGHELITDPGIGGYKIE